MPLSNNLIGKEAMRFFQSRGLSRAQAAGIVGNMQQESSLNPNARGGGLIQGQGGRTSSGTAHQQFEGVWRELTGPERSTLGALKGAKSPEQAARIFSQRFERPGVPMLPNRERYAREAFGSAASGVSGATQASLSPPGAPQAQGPTFDLQGFQKAQKASVVGKLLSSEGGSRDKAVVQAGLGGSAGSNPLLASGLATTKPPERAEFEHPGVPGAPTPHQGPAVAQPQHPGQIEPLLHTMNAIAQAKVPYLWGGGHAARFLPGQQVRPLDCSGAVSAALGINPKVSGEFEQWGQSGRGQYVTIYANKHHVLMEVNGHFWGTSSTNPGGGAGWIRHGAITPQYLSQFRARHPVGM